MNNILIKEGNIVTSTLITVENNYIIYVGLEFNNDSNNHIIYDCIIKTNLSDGFYKYDKLNDNYIFIE